MKRERNAKNDVHQLMARPKEELVSYVYELLALLKEDERIRFIAENISPQSALQEAGVMDAKKFLQSVELYCQLCMQGIYYIAPYEFADPDDYYYDYDEGDEEIDFFSEHESCYDYHASDWANVFPIFFRNALLFGQNNDDKTAFQALDQLLDCVIMAIRNENVFGTTNPMTYIDVAWDDIFAMYRKSLDEAVPDWYRKALCLVPKWLCFGKWIEPAMAGFAQHLQALENGILSLMDQKKIADNELVLLYDLLERLYHSAKMVFPVMRIATLFAQYHPDFYGKVADELFQRQQWKEVADLAQQKLSMIMLPNVYDKMKRQQIHSLDALGLEKQSYETALQWMMEDPDYDHYLLVRDLAVRQGCLTETINCVTQRLRNSQNKELLLLLSIYAKEGYDHQLYKTAMRNHHYERLSGLKYAAKALLYQGLHDVRSDLPQDLNEYLQRIEENRFEGIWDYAGKQYTSKDRQAVLKKAIDLLKEIVELHIASRKVKRYGTAAYYCVLIRDICMYLEITDEFARYYREIALQYSSRRGLRQELASRLGDTWEALELC